MKLWVSFLILFSFQVQAQVTDDFDDEDLYRDPEWTGQVSSFTSVNGEMRSNHSSANSIFFLATQGVGFADMEWRLNCRLMFNPSSVNYVDFVLFSDTAALIQAKNAYFVRLGGSMDEISLFNINNGLETKIIDGVDGLMNSSMNHFQIVVQKFGDSFVLKRSKPGESLVTEGTSGNRTVRSAAFAGIRIRQSTTSFMNKHFFDDLYIGPLIRDTLPPVLDSLSVLSGTELQCIFSEPCDSLSLIQTANYYVEQRGLSPSAAIPGALGKMVTLRFDEPLVPNVMLTLRVDNIADKTGNIMQEVRRSFNYVRPDTPMLYDLLITEIFPDPEPQVALPVYEYVEIMNVSGKFLRLTSCRINDPTSFKILPDMILPPDSILVLKAIPSLNNSGDHIWISNQKNETIHSISYTDNWYNDPDKQEGGYSLEMIDHTKPCLGSRNWAASNDLGGGTPGWQNSVKALLSADTMPPVMLNLQAVNDSILELVFDESVDSLSLISARFYINGIETACQIKNVPASDRVSLELLFVPDKLREYLLSFSGIADLCGNWTGLKDLRFQWPSASRQGELLINEILFNPRSGGQDFIELYNHSEFAFDLSKHSIADAGDDGQLKNKYPLAPLGTILKPFQYALVTTDTLQVCADYDCGNGMLKIQLERMPSMPDDNGHIILFNRDGVVIDSLKYSEDWHFPLLNDKNGVSLERLNARSSGEQRCNWHSAASTVNYATPGYKNSNVIMPKKTNSCFSPQSRSLSPDEDGFEDLMVLRYQLPGPDFLATVIIYDVEGRMIKHLANNVTLGAEGLLTWDGIDENGRKAPVGIYIVWIECINPSGERIRQKFSIVLAARF